MPSRTTLNANQVRELGRATFSGTLSALASKVRAWQRHRPVNPKQAYLPPPSFKKSPLSPPSDSMP
ncbi:MAG TPA: hypothetical protein PLB25_18000, partial [Rhodoferax sp.]|nr:hypothetical protein [Rhodoferax sp.]